MNHVALCSAPLMDWPLMGSLIVGVVVRKSISTSDFAILSLRWGRTCFLLPVPHFTCHTPLTILVFLHICAFWLSEWVYSHVTCPDWPVMNIWIFSPWSGGGTAVESPDPLYDVIALRKITPSSDFAILSLGWSRTSFRLHVIHSSDNFYGIFAYMPCSYPSGLNLTSLVLIDRGMRLWVFEFSPPVSRGGPQLSLLVPLMM